MFLSNLAYLDPSVITMLMGPIAILVVGGIVFAIVAMVRSENRKIQNKQNDNLSIDENAKKEVEEDVTGSFED